jgi:hypothetical protein
LIGFLVISFRALPQNFNDAFISEKSLLSSDTNKLFLNIENSNFFKNNEYFNDFVEGYTLLGYFFHPSLVYKPTSNTNVEAGVHFLKYSGIESFTKVLPTFRFQYEAGQKLDIVFGNIYGTYNHGLIEPIFKPERYFTDNIENGLQFLYHTNRFKSDLWVNWEQFIFQGSPYQEKFTIGYSAKYLLKESSGSGNIYIPFQMVGTHRGGQINSTDEHLQSIINSALGIIWDYNVDKKWLKSLSVQQYILSFTDVSPDKQLPYIYGRALYSNLYLNSGYFKIMLGWWYGDFFISSRGEPLYQSVSTIDKNYKEPQRAMFISKFKFEKRIFRDIIIGAGVETYFDLYNYNLDYTYGVHIIFNRNFFLRKI